MFTIVVVDVSVTESKLFVQTRQKAIMVTQLTATAIPSLSSSATALLPSFFQSICQNQSQKTKKVDQEKTSQSILCKDKWIDYLRCIHKTYIYSIRIDGKYTSF